MILAPWGAKFKTPFGDFPSYALRRLKVRNLNMPVTLRNLCSLARRIGHPKGCLRERRRTAGEGLCLNCILKRIGSRCIIIPDFWGLRPAAAWYRQSPKNGDDIQLPWIFQHGMLTGQIPFAREGSDGLQDINKALVKKGQAGWHSIIKKGGSSKISQK